MLDDAVDVQGCCRKAEELFELYQRCANRKQIETICVNFLRGMEATKLSVTGHMYFVPRTFMERVDIFEDFITLLSGLNKKQTPLLVNSFYIIDDAKQRDIVGYPDKSASISWVSNGAQFPFRSCTYTYKES